MVVRDSLGVLHERDFRLLLAGQTLSNLGSALVPIALAFAVLDLTGSATDLGLVLQAARGRRPGRRSHRGRRDALGRRRVGSS